jgi:hypothetical protein
VLSLNRNYARFVVPRLDRFETRFPNIVSIKHLVSEIAKHSSPDEFVRTTLDYKHQERAETLAAVCRWLLTLSSAESPNDDLKILKVWADNAHHSDYKNLRIRGFGLAGFQYLRMLFGANTTKPDIWICKWVAEVVGHSVSAGQALELLEPAATEANVSLKDADTTIWRMLSTQPNKAKTSKNMLSNKQNLNNDEPREFFATIHYRNYAPGEIEKINENLQMKKKGC